MNIYISIRFCYLVSISPLVARMWMQNEEPNLCKETILSMKNLPHGVYCPFLPARLNGVCVCVGGATKCSNTKSCIFMFSSSTNNLTDIAVTADHDDHHSPDKTTNIHTHTHTHTHSLFLNRVAIYLIYTSVLTLLIYYCVCVCVSIKWKLDIWSNYSLWSSLCSLLFKFHFQVECYLFSFLFSCSLTRYIKAIPYFM